MPDLHPDDKIDHVCDVCGTEWIVRGEPSEEGTQCCVVRCYCHVDVENAFEQLDKVVRALTESKGTDPHDQ